jgi:hypothetical protein
MRIMGPPTAELNGVLKKLTGLGAADLFVGTIAPEVWRAALRYGIDPVGAVAQAAKETAYGRFGGAITAGWRNTCGLKVRDTAMVMALLGTTNQDHALVHQQFGSWTLGALAHAQHLRAYAGCPITDETVVDSRYEWVIGKHQCLSFEDLGGHWAPATDYGIRLVEIANKLIGA